MRRLSRKEGEPLLLGIDRVDREEDAEEEEPEEELLLERDLDFERDGERLESEGDLERSTEDLDE